MFFSDCHVLVQHANCQICLPSVTSSLVKSLSFSQAAAAVGETIETIQTSDRMDIKQRHTKRCITVSQKGSVQLNT